MTPKINFAELLGIKAGDERLRFLGEAAYMWLYLGCLDKAAGIFEGLTLLAPGDPVGKMGLAETALARRDFKQAEKFIELAIRSRNADRRTTAYAYIVRGQALWAQNKRADARKIWQRAEAFDPASAEAGMARQWLEAAAKEGEKVIT